MCLEIIVRRQHTGTHQLLRQNLHKVQQVLRVRIADVVNRIGRNGQPVLAILLFRRFCHHTDNAFYDVVHIGKVPLAVTVIKNLDSLTVDQLIGETKVSHIRTTRRAIYREEPQASGGNVVEL